MNRAARDQAIAKAFRAGIRRNTLSEIFGLTPRRISQIAALYGASRPLGGRRPDPLLAQLGPDLRHYRNARQYFGAKEARRMFGIAA